MEEKKEADSLKGFAKPVSMNKVGSSLPLEELPAPPKFNLNDLPEPPKIEERKKSLFGNPFSKDKTQQNKTNRPLPPPLFTEKDLDDDIENQTQQVLGKNKKNEIPPPPELKAPPRIIPMQERNKVPEKSNSVIPEPQSANIQKQEEIKFPFDINSNLSQQKNSSNVNFPLDFAQLPKDQPIGDKTGDNKFNLNNLPPPPPLAGNKEKKGLFSNIFSKKTNESSKNITKETSVPIELPLPNSISLNDDNTDLFSENIFEKKLNEKSDTAFPLIPLLPSISQIKENTDKELQKQGSNDKSFAQNQLFDSKPLPEEKNTMGSFIYEEQVKKDIEPIMQPTPLNAVPGVGEKTEKLLKKKLNINSAEELAGHDHRHVAKVTKISPAVTKKIIAHAKRIKKNNIIKSKKQTSKAPVKDKTISDLITSLETEKKEIEKLKSEGITDLPDLRGHKEIMALLEKLEKKKLEIFDYETNLKEKEKNLHSVKSTYQRDAEYLDNMRRRLDHDIRERTRYLIELEKEFFEKGQKLAKDMSKVELGEEHINGKENELKEKEAALRKRLHELEDREISMNAKEKSLQKLLKQLERQEVLLKKKEEELNSSDAKFMQRMETLRQHEVETDKLLKEKKKNLEEKEKDLKRLEKDIEKRERVIDIEDRAIDYAETEVEGQRKKLEDDEFKQYLHEKLGVMKEAGISVNDINRAQNIKVPDMQEHRETIQDLITKCRHLLKLGRTQEAKIFYNKIRQTFYTFTFASRDEKESLYNTVRLLYDEINLAEMEDKNN